MEVVKVNLPRDFTLVLSSDYHLGNTNCHKELLREMVESVAARRKKKIKAYLANLGDNIDSIAPDDKRYKHASVDFHAGLMTPKAQADAVVELLRPIKDRVLAIGEGNHECVGVDTEILTASGWVEAGALTTEHAVASFSKTQKVISFAKPVGVSPPFEAPAYSLTGSFHDELVSENHKVYLDGQMSKVSDIDPVISQSRFTYAGTVFQGYQTVTHHPDLIALLTWVVCDGCIVICSPGKKRIQFKLSKPRKIEALKQLLEKMGIEYTFALCKKTGVNNLQPYYIRIYGQEARDLCDLLGDVKSFPEWFKYLDPTQTARCIDTLWQTDGCYDPDGANRIIRLRTTSKTDADTLQLMCVFNNIPCKIEVTGRSGFAEDGKVQYVVSIANRGLYNRNKVKKTPVDGAVALVAIETKDGTLITRRNGKVVFTGNSKLWNLESFGQTIAKDLGVAFGGYNYILQVHDLDDKLMFKVFCSHGSGRLPKGAKDPIQRKANRRAHLKRKLDATGISDCILFAMGHTHQLETVAPTIEDELLLTTDGDKIRQHTRPEAAQNSSYIPPERRYYANTGGFLKLYSPPGSKVFGYAEIGLMEPTKLGWVEVDIREGKVIGLREVEGFSG